MYALYVRGDYSEDRFLAFVCMHETQGWKEAPSCTVTEKGFFLMGVRIFCINFSTCTFRGLLPRTI